MAGQDRVPPKSRLRRLSRGFLSTSGTLFAWAGRVCGPLLRRFRTQERLEQGLVIVLPGIESQSFLNHSVVWGLADAGWPGAVEIYDWTTSVTLLFPYHLRGWKRNLKQAELIAQRIVQYQKDFPDRPVHLVGHSGGGALSILALKALPAEIQIESAVLLAPALSPDFVLTPALRQVRTQVWNFWSIWDMVFCGAGTVLLGTIDGKHRFSAGMVGFQIPLNHTSEDEQVYAEKLTQVKYQWSMARAFHLGGHFGPANRVFVAEWVGPILMSKLSKPSEVSNTND